MYRCVTHPQPLTKLDSVLLGLSDDFAWQDGTFGWFCTAALHAEYIFELNFRLYQISQECRCFFHRIVAIALTSEPGPEVNLGRFSAQEVVEGDAVERGQCLQLFQTGAAATLLDRN